MSNVENRGWCGDWAAFVPSERIIGRLTPATRGVDLVRDHPQRVAWLLRARDVDLDEVLESQRRLRHPRWLLRAEEGGWRVDYSSGHRSHSASRWAGWETVSVLARWGHLCLDLGKPGVLWVRQANDRGNWVTGTLEDRISFAGWLQTVFGKAPVAAWIDLV